MYDVKDQMLSKNEKSPDISLYYIYLPKLHKKYLEIL